MHLCDATQNLPFRCEHGLGIGTLKEEQRPLCGAELISGPQTKIEWLAVSSARIKRCLTVVLSCRVSSSKHVADRTCPRQPSANHHQSEAHSTLLYILPFSSI